MPSILKAHIENTPDADQAFYVNILYEDGTSKTDYFDTFEEANQWLSEQEGTLPSSTTDGSLPDNGSPASGKRDEDATGEPVPPKPAPHPQDLGLGDETANSNALQSNNEQLKAEEEANASENDAASSST